MRNVGSETPLNDTVMIDLADRPALAVADTEFALHRALEKFPILHGEGLIQPELPAQALYVGLGAFLAEHVVDRVADETEHRERDQADDQQDDDRLKDPTDDVGEHRSASSR